MSQGACRMHDRKVLHSVVMGITGRYIPHSIPSFKMPVAVPVTRILFRVFL